MKLRYPATRKVEQYDDYFGTVVHDPYRWLEEDTEEVAAWVGEQNALTESYLSQIPFREELRERIQELMNFPRYSSAKKVGDKYYFLYNDGLQEQSVLYVQDGFDGEPRVFLDPHTFSEDGSLTLVSFVISNDRTFMSYSIAEAGSDWNDVRIIDLESGKTLPDFVQNVFTPQTWEPHWFKDGFFYSQWGDPTTGDPDVVDAIYTVRYHKVGTPSESDELVWSDPENDDLSFNIDTAQTDTLQFLFVYNANTPGNGFYIRRAGSEEFVRFHDDHAYEVQDIGDVDGDVLIYTNVGAPMYRVVRADPATADSRYWRTIVPERNEPIEEAGLFGGRLIVLYSKDAHHHLYQYDLEGNFECEIELPGIGTISNLTGWRDDPIFLFEFSGFTTPRSIYEYDVRTRKLRLFKRNHVPYSIDEYETQQLFVGSKDGTQIPIFIVAKKDLDRSSAHPTILTGYGGFNAILSPIFRPPIIAFLERGGIYVQANLRGGGEYGMEWYHAGSRYKKQNSFDDFIAVAEYLCESRYTSPQHLAITGSSHGGLLVGAVMTQRPDLFAVAIPDVGVLDMLRFQNLGEHDYAREYGISDNEVDFRYLISYSPLHNLKPGLQYPATLVRTAEKDDRVSPVHSFKFAATLQECQASGAPALLSVSMQSGHGKGLTLSKAIAKVADDFAFVLYHTTAEIL